MATRSEPEITDARHGKMLSRSDSILSGCNWGLVCKQDSSTHITHSVRLVLRFGDLNTPQVRQWYSPILPHNGAACRLLNIGLLERVTNVSIQQLRGLTNLPLINADRAHALFGKVCRSSQYRLVPGDRALSCASTSSMVTDQFQNRSVPVAALDGCDSRLGL